MNARTQQLSLSDAIAHHVASTKIQHIPSASLKAAKLTILDTLGVAWAGLGATGVAAARATALDIGGRADARVWGADQKLPATEAAFANGVAAAALDFDALHLEGTVHADIVALPALLAVAERTRASGSDFLTSYVVAQDLIARLGLAAPGHSGWFYTSIHGIYGAAASSAKLLGLTHDGIRDALALSLPQAGGTQQPMVEKSIAKRLQSAFAARGGVYAALLAAKGLSGPREVFEGRFGAFALYEASDATKILDRIGEHWENLGIGFKKFPNCGCAHAALDAALELVEAHNLHPQNVSNIEVVLTPYSHRLVGAPYAPHTNPEVSAQFSIQYAIATALRRRSFGVEDLTAGRALDPETIALADRVKVKIDESQTGRMAPALVTFHTASGEFSKTATTVPGGKERPLSAEDVKAKARISFASGPHALGAAAIERLIDTVSDLESLADVNRLWG